MPQQEILDSKEYFQEFFFPVFNQSDFTQMEDLSICLCFSLGGPGGGEWTLRFSQGKLIEVIPEKATLAELCYVLDTTTFFQITSGQLDPQQAFFQGKVKLEGDTFKALEMANILTQFFSAYPYKKTEPLSFKLAQKQLPIVEERVYFASEGKDKRIEGILAYRDEARTPMGVLIVPPHPHLGGNMSNNIVICLAQNLALDDRITLRFNYGGVGNSQVTLPTSQGELKAFWKESLSPVDNQMLSDVLGAISFLTRQISQMRAGTSVPGEIKDESVAIIGYSFGAYLAALAARDCPSVSALIMVAPPVSFHNFESIKYPKIPKLIIGSDNDFACGTEALQEFYNAMEGTKKMALLSGKDHFFVGQEKEIASLAQNFLEEHQRRSNIMKILAENWRQG